MVPVLRRAASFAFLIDAITALFPVFLTNFIAALIFGSMLPSSKQYNKNSILQDLEKQKRSIK